MTRKKNGPGTSTSDLPVLRIGSRVRSTNDNVEGRIVWANGVSVKIKWNDGEQVTWKRAELGSKGLEFLDDELQEVSTSSEAPMVVKLALANTPKSEEAGDTTEKKLSAIDAAAKVLAEARKPMNCQELIGVMAIQNYWISPGGKTPAATLYSAILRELARGDESRFVKTGRGYFTLKA